MLWKDSVMLTNENMGSELGREQGGHEFWWEK